MIRFGSDSEKVMRHLAERLIQHRGAEKKRIKVKVRRKTQIVGTVPQIIVTGTAEKPYYEIQYLETKDGETHLGFGSYELAYVFQWLEEFFGVTHASAVDPENLRPKGKWRLNKDGSGTCSECHRTRSDVWDMDNWDNFCSHCGADMRGRADDGE